MCSARDTSDLHCPEALLDALLVFHLHPGKRGRVFTPLEIARVEHASPHRELTLGHRGGSSLKVVQETPQLGRLRLALGSNDGGLFLLL